MLDQVDLKLLDIEMRTRKNNLTGRVSDIIEGHASGLIEEQKAFTEYLITRAKRHRDGLDTNIYILSRVPENVPLEACFVALNRAVEGQGYEIAREFGGLLLARVTFRPNCVPADQQNF